MIYWFFSIHTGSDATGPPSFFPDSARRRPALMGLYTPFFFSYFPLKSRAGFQPLDLSNPHSSSFIDPWSFFEVDL